MFWFESVQKNGISNYTGSMMWCKDPGTVLYFILQILDQQIFYRPHFVFVSLCQCFFI